MRAKSILAFPQRVSSTLRFPNSGGWPETPCKALAVNGPNGVVNGQAAFRPMWQKTAVCWKSNNWQHDNSNLSDICYSGWMNQPTPIGTLEGRLCGHLAAALANYFVRAEGSKGPARKGDTFWHSGMHAFEVAHEALEAIGVFPFQKRPDGLARSHFVVDAEQMPDFLAMQDVSDKISEILEAFVGVACGYGGLPDRGNWFDCPEKWSVAMKYLSLAGYAEQSGSRFRWTEKIKPAMLAANMWDEKVRPLDELADTAFEAEVERAWQTMSDTLRQAIRSSNIGFIELVKVLALSWRDGRWHDFNQDQKVVLTGQIPLAHALIKKALSS